MIVVFENSNQTNAFHDKILKNIINLMQLDLDNQFALKENDGKIKVSFNTPQLAVTPGQSIAFYINDVLIGGGVIELT